jgi:hypothetical protein
MKKADLPPDVRPICWLCVLYRGIRTELVQDTDGNGQRVEVCPKCRPELEALQREVAQLRARLTPHRVVRLCRKCKKEPVALRKHLCSHCAAPAVKPSKRCGCGAAIAPHAKACDDCTKRRWTEAHTRNCTGCHKDFLHAKKGHPPNQCWDCRHPAVLAPAPRTGPKPAIRFNLGNRGLWKTYPIKDRVLLLSREHPDWSGIRVAAAAGVCFHTVYRLWKLNGIAPPQPHKKVA